MRRLVKERFDGEDHFAVWSSVVMGTVTDFLPREEMAHLLKQDYPEADVDAMLVAAVSIDDVY